MSCEVFISIMHLFIVIFLCLRKRYISVFFSYFAFLKTFIMTFIFCVDCEIHAVFIDCCLMHALCF